jgi:hypothetical protein
MKIIKLKSNIKILIINIMKMRILLKRKILNKIQKNKGKIITYQKSILFVYNLK